MEIVYYDCVKPYSVYKKISSEIRNYVFMLQKMFHEELL